jgi:hypothetical protein
MQRLSKKRIFRRNSPNTCVNRLRLSDVFWFARRLAPRRCSAAAFLAAVAPAIAEGQSRICRTSIGPSARLQGSSARPAYVERLLAIRSGNQIWMVGTPAWFWLEARRAIPPVGRKAPDTIALLERLRENHGLIGGVMGPDQKLEPLRGPVDAKRMIRPIPILDASGVLSLFWSESPVPGEFSRTTSLWHAEFDGKKWSQPHKLYENRRVLWYPHSSTVLVAGSDLHVLAAARGPGAGITHVRRVKGKWSSAFIPIRGASGQFSARMLGRDSLVVVVVATDSKVRVSNGQHVFVHVAAVTDTVWESGRRLQWSGLDGAVLPKLFPIRAGGADSKSFAVFWGHIPAAGRGIDTVYSLVSSENIRTWMPASPLVLTSVSHTYEMEQDHQGKIHLITLGSPSPQYMPLHHAEWFNGRWSQPDSIGYASTSLVTLSALSADTILAAWSVTEKSSPDGSTGPLPVTTVALLHQTCGTR